MAPGPCQEHEAHRVKGARTLTPVRGQESEPLCWDPSPKLPAPDLDCPRELCPPGQGWVDLGRRESLWALGCCQDLMK